MLAFIRARRKVEAISAVLLLVFAGVAATLSAASTTASARPPIVVAATLTLTGPNSPAGQEALRSLRLYFTSLNQDGGIDGRPIDLQVYDDKGDPATALQIAHTVAASRALFVFGQLYSYLGVAPSRVYRAAQVPAITAYASRNDLTIDNPYYFRMYSTIATEAGGGAAYAHGILGFQQATVIHDADSGYSVPQGATFASTFSRLGGKVVASLGVDSTNSATLQRTLRQVTQSLAHITHPGIIFLAMLAPPAVPTIVALRRAGITAPILTTDDPSSGNFEADFAAYPEEQRQVGYFTNGIYTPSNVFYDSAPDAAQAFAATYRQTYGVAPTTAGAMHYAAAQVLTAALQSARIQGTASNVASDRRAIRDALAAIDSPATGVYTINGLVYFPSSHNSIMHIRYGQWQGGRLISAPLQLNTIDNPALVNLAVEQRAGNIVSLNGAPVWKQHVVYTGININKIGQINVGAGTFSADFYFWLRYSGSDDATHIVFTNATNDVTFEANQPLDAEVLNGLHYRLYHVSGDFKAAYDFHDYPFDRQTLSISFQNTSITRDQLTYVIDAQGLRLRDDNTPDPATAAAAFSSLASWSYLSTRYSSDTFTSTSTLGNPFLFEGHTQTDYSGLQVTMTVQRDARAFLVNHLLPLVLLFLIVYATLHCPPSLLKERLTVPVTALLAGAVLLTAINSALPDIGYAVAVAYAFYIFFFLCLAAIVTAVIDDRLIGAKRVAMAHRADLVMRLIYIAVVVVMIGSYWQDFGARLT